MYEERRSIFRLKKLIEENEGRGETRTSNLHIRR